jgi:hypothetical protein
VVIHTNFVDGKNTLDQGQISLCTCNGGSRICAVEWIGVNMWCINSHLTNKMLVHVNSKLGHLNDWILLPKESLTPITCMDIWDIWIKFLGLTIAIVAKLNTIVLLDYSNPIFG